MKCVYRLAVFDLDGTLLDTLDDLANACNYALRMEGLPEHPREAYKRFVGNGEHQLILRATAPVNDAASIQRVEAAFHARYTAYPDKDTRPYPGVVKMLSCLRAQGVMTAVLSNKLDEHVQPLVQRYFPGLLTCAYGQRQGFPLKPDPQAALALLHELSVPVEDCVYVGDSSVDMQMGKRAGVYTVGVAWGFRTKDELVQSGADVVVDEIAALEKIILDNKTNIAYTDNNK